MEILKLEQVEEYFQIRLKRGVTAYHLVQDLCQISKGQIFNASVGLVGFPPPPSSKAQSCIS